MNARPESYRELLRITTRPAFLGADLLGVLSLMGSQLLIPDPWRGAFAALGSAFLTIGISLPIALLFQLKAEVDSLRIMDACNRSGIKAIFKSRLSDAQALRSAIDAAADGSIEIGLLGVAFRSLFNPSGESTEKLRDHLDNFKIKLRILLLNPKSEAAKRRAAIEKGNTTIDDIQFTLDHGIPAMVQERRNLVLDHDHVLKQEFERNALLLPDEFVKRLAKACNFEVRLYDLDPMLLIMMFGKSVFAEQYHLGRPDSLRAKSCIGKHVPMIEYSKASECAKFFCNHFETLWELSKNNDETLAIIRKEILCNDSEIMVRS